MRPRATYLLQSDLALLEDWAQRVRLLFRGEAPFLVGSALTFPGFRDVDVRVILDDEHYEAIDGWLNLPQLNLAVSLWGQKATGLPIDFQVQQMTEANATFNGRRNAIGLGGPS